MGIACKLLSHSRDARRTWHDGLDWRSSCKRCGIPMIKGDQKCGFIDLTTTTSVGMGSRIEIRRRKPL
jgi:hypothetical protein